MRRIRQARPCRAVRAVRDCEERCGGVMADAGDCEGRRSNVMVDAGRGRCGGSGRAIAEGSSAACAGGAAVACVAISAASGRRTDRGDEKSAGGDCGPAADAYRGRGERFRSIGTED
jgi:hypothetical protein